jgi:hypothetical protein
MGQQVYERQIADRVQQAIGARVTVGRSVTRSLRSPLPGTALVRQWVLREAPAGVRRAVGALMYPRAVAWRLPDESSREPFAAQETRRARAVISVSGFAADDVAERLNLDHVHVVHNGIDERFLEARPLTTEQLRGLGVDGPHVVDDGVAGGRARARQFTWDAAAGQAAVWRDVLVGRA